MDIQEAIEMHRIKSAIVILVLVGILVAIGFMVGKEGRITGAAIANGVACFEDKDCNDRIAATQDVCRNPGTVYSLCVNKPNR